MNRNQITIDNIQKLRKEKKYSIEKIAEMVNKSKSAYDRLEKGDVELTLNDAKKIANTLDTDFSTITNSGNTFNNENSSII